MSRRSILRFATVALAAALVTPFSFAQQIIKLSTVGSPGTELEFAL